MLKLKQTHSLRQLHRFSRLLSFCSSAETQKLCQIVSNVGSLDDLETNLQQLGVEITKSEVTQVIDLCKDLAHPRRLLRFFTWYKRQASSDLGDDEFNFLIRVLAEKGDLTALDILMDDLKKERRKMEVNSWGCLADTLVKFGREDDAVGLFKKIEILNCPEDKIGFTKLVHALCERGHAKKAEQVVRRSKNMFGTGPTIYKCLIHGWCVDGNEREARRVFADMKNEGIDPSIVIYNDLLKCVCERNVKCNPSALVQDANDLMTEMRSYGVLPNSISFNILLSCLGRVRRIKEACRVLSSMKGMGCPPDWMSYYLVVKVLYLSGRIVRGNIVMDEMFDNGLVPGTRFYRDLIGILCGIDQVDYALELFERMKTNCLQDCGPVYDLLIEKLCMGGQFEKGEQLWDEAVEKGHVLQSSKDILNPRRTTVFKPVRKMDLEECKSILNAVTKEEEIRMRLKRKQKQNGKRSRITRDRLEMFHCPQAVSMAYAHGRSCGNHGCGLESIA